MKKILILSANPKNTTNLRLDEEIREIKNIMQLSPNRAEFELVTESNDDYRLVRSLRLTDETWKALGMIAESFSLSRADYLEHLAKHNFSGAFKSGCVVFD